MHTLAYVTVDDDAGSRNLFNDGSHLLFFYCAADHFTHLSAAFSFFYFFGVRVLL